MALKWLRIENRIYLRGVKIKLWRVDRMNFTRCIKCYLYDPCERIKNGCGYTNTECNNKNLYKEKEKDNVNSPAHYTQGKIETIDYIQDKLTKEEMIGAMKFNIIKYISRERLKNGAEDIKKAEWYLRKLIEVMEAK